MLRSEMINECYPKAMWSERDLPICWANALPITPPCAPVRTSGWREMFQARGRIWTESWSFNVKDLYLVIAPNLILLQICRFHEIRQISHEIWWISGMKSADFSEIQQISCEIHQISCLEIFKSDNSRKKLHFHRVQGGYVIWTLWNLPDFR